jgi:hypothetical protein
MTKTVAKGTNRPAATARKARHAQTTPLPPKGKAENIALAAEAVAEHLAPAATTVKRGDVMACPECGKPVEVRADGQSLFTHNARPKVQCPMSRVAIYNLPTSEPVQETSPEEQAVNEALDEAHGVTPFGRSRKSRKAAPAPVVEMDEDGITPVDEDTEGDHPESPAPKVRKRAKKAPSVDAAGPKPAPVGDTKAHRYAAHTDFAGWTTEVQTDGDYAELVARRWTETIHLTWINGVYQAGATYTIADRTVQIRNVAEARRWAQRSPEAATEVLSKVVSNKAFRRREVPEQEQGRQKLPFALDDSERVILDALAGRKVRWHNRFTAQPEIAVLDTDPRRLRLEEQNGERVVLFCSPGHGGFRAFRLSAVLAVK